MNPTLGRIAFVSAAWVSLAACGGHAAEPGPAQGGEGGESFLKADDFSDPSSGWPTRSSSG